MNAARTGVNAIEPPPPDEVPPPPKTMSFIRDYIEFIFTSRRVRFIDAIFDAIFIAPMPSLMAIYSTPRWDH